ncbi:MAG: hypothetical protein OXI79_03570 [Gammaproteobacteria bacterium]|nr:hypothetical protein [Gammaproteobacteria bacterium]
MSTRRVALASITARLLWDGRAEAGRFIPGVAHFQSGVAALRRAEEAGAAERLAEIAAAIARAEDAVNRWARGLAAFARESLAGAEPEPRDWGDPLARRLRVRTPEAERLAALVVAFDAACAAASAATALARSRGVFNPHHAGIAECARMIRRIADLGHAGGLACRKKRRSRRSSDTGAGRNAVG